MQSQFTLKDLRMCVAAAFRGQRVQPTLEAVLFDMAGGGAQGFKRAAILTQAVYWSEKEGGGWWYKTDADWEGETRVKRVSAEASALASCGLESETKPRTGGTSPTRHYRLDTGKFVQRFAATIGLPVDRVLALLGRPTLSWRMLMIRAFRLVIDRLVELLKSDNSNCQNPTNRTAENRQLELSKSDSLVPSVLESESDSGEESGIMGSRETGEGAGETDGPLESHPDFHFFKIWRAAYWQLEYQLDRPSFDTFLRRAKFLRMEGETYIIGIVGAWERDMCAGRLYRNIERLLRDASGGPVEIRFETIAPPAVEKPAWTRMRSA